MAMAQTMTMPLSMARAGETATVRDVRGASDMRRHLQEIGFVDGAQVHVVAASRSNIIVTVKGARFGIDATLARRVMVA